MGLGTQTQVPAIVRLHLEAFPGTLTARLGPAFLARYYSSILVEPAGLLVVATDASGLAGFAAGSTSPDQLYEKLYRSRLSMAFLLMTTLVRHPSLIPPTRSAMSSAHHRARQADDATAELASLAVSPRRTRSGIGTLLVERYCGLAADRGAHQLLVRTPAESNEPVLRFYMRLGFAERERYRQGRSRHMIALRRPLDERGGPSHND